MLRVTVHSNCKDVEPADNVQRKNDRERMG